MSVHELLGMSPKKSESAGGDLALTGTDVFLAALRHCAWRPCQPSWLVPEEVATEAAEAEPESDQHETGELPPPVARRQSSTTSFSGVLSMLSSSRSGLSGSSGTGEITTLPGAMRMILSKLLQAEADEARSKAAGSSPVRAACLRAARTALALASHRSSAAVLVRQQQSVETSRMSGGDTAITRSSVIGAVPEAQAIDHPDVDLVELLTEVVLEAEGDALSLGLTSLDTKEKSLSLDEFKHAERSARGVYTVWALGLRSPTATLKEVSLRALGDVLERVRMLSLRCVDVDGAVVPWEHYLALVPAKRIESMVARRLDRELEDSPRYSRYLHVLVEFSSLLRFVREKIAESHRSGGSAEDAVAKQALVESDNAEFGIRFTGLDTETREEMQKAHASSAGAAEESKEPESGAGGADKDDKVDVPVMPHEVQLVRLGGKSAVPCPWTIEVWVRCRAKRGPLARQKEKSRSVSAAAAGPASGAASPPSAELSLLEDPSSDVKVPKWHRNAIEQVPGWGEMLDSEKHQELELHEYGLVAGVQPRPLVESSSHGASSRGFGKFAVRPTSGADKFEPAPFRPAAR